MIRVVFQIAGVSIAALLCSLAASSSSSAERRVALVIGNGAYEHASPLANPVNDARDLAAKLQGLGFEVVTGYDLNLSQTRSIIKRFIGQLAGADVSMFYYAGHGLQVNGENYIAPVDATLRSDVFLDFETISIGSVISAMEKSTKTNLVFLDACRDNPLAERLARSMGTRSNGVGRGLAKISSGIGTLIAFSTQPGNVALDGDGRNSPYAAALLKHLGTPGRDISSELVAVRNDVLKATDGKQVPWENSSLTGAVILTPEVIKREPVQEVKQPNAAASYELAFWDSVKDMQSAEGFEDYLRRWPDGMFATLAKLKIKNITTQALIREKKVDLEKQENLSAAQLEIERQRMIQQEQIRTQLALDSSKQELELAKQKLEEQQRLLTEAKRTQAALEAAKAEIDLLREATNKQKTSPQPVYDTISSSDETVKTAAIDPSSVEQLEKQSRFGSERDLVRAIQKELDRHRCNPGPVDGLWGRKVISAAQQFAKYAKLSVALEPSEDFLEKIEKVEAPQCPVVCGPRYRVVKSRCILKSCRSGYFLNPQGNCEQNRKSIKSKKNKENKRISRPSVPCYLCKVNRITPSSPALFGETRKVCTSGNPKIGLRGGWSCSKM